MPIYEYQCEVCGTRTEQIQKSSDPPLDVCPHCGKGPVRRLMSSPAIQFKGSGWYITDYAKKGSDSGTDKGPDSPKADSDKSAKPEGGDTKTAPSDSKGAASDTKTSSDGGSSSTSAPSAPAPAPAKKD